MTIHTEQVRRAFGQDVAVDEVTIDVADNEIHAIVGLNGAGKTTLMRLILNMLRPDSGVARIGGADVAGFSGADWARVGYLIETPFAYNELTVSENLLIAAKLRGLRQQAAPEHVEASISRFGLARWADKRAAELSLGNRQRLGLAAATIHEPSTLILDEPANGLDPAGVVFVRDWLRKSAAAGSSILVSSHHFDQLARIADRITVIHRGRVVGALDPADKDLEHRFFELALEADLSTGVDA